jgi:hypothetical protein
VDQRIVSRVDDPRFEWVIPTRVLAARDGSTSTTRSNRSSPSA